MIVVAIVAVLAILGMVGYNRIIRASRATEARQMIGAIKIAQESRRAETGSYGQPSNGALGNWCPAGAGGSTKFAWNPGCQAWNTLPVQSDGPVMFQYSSVSGRAVVDAVPAVNILGAAVNWPTPPQTDWFITMAQIDQNGDGTFCRALGSSFTNEITVENEGD